MDGRIDGCAFAPQFSTIPNTFTGVRAPACRSAFHKYSLNGRGRSRPSGGAGTLLPAPINQQKKNAD